MRSPAALFVLLCAALNLGACSDHPDPMGPSTKPAGRSGALQCTASLRAPSLSCAASPGGAVLAIQPAGEVWGGPGDQIIGGQGLNVLVTSRAPSYDSVRQIFRVEVNVRNLMPGRVLGSYDGDATAGIRVFFHLQPAATVGWGDVSIRNADGTGTFITAAQPFFAYGEKLATGQASQFHPWEFQVPRTVERFAFTVYVEGPVWAGETLPEPSRAFTQISGTGTPICGVTDEGRVFCWGETSVLGRGPLGAYAENLGIPYEIAAGNRRFTAVAAGSRHACALDRAGKAYCWGYTWSGQAGALPVFDTAGYPHPTERPIHTPTPVPGDLTFASIEASPGRTCAVDVQGAAYCWGDNSLGQLGNGTSQSTHVPAPVQAPLRFTQVRMGWDHTCGLTPEGDLWCWGHNYFGQIGQPCGEACGTPAASSVAKSLVPLRVPSDESFAAFDLAANHTCALTRAGRALCWGRGGWSRLGSGPPTEGAYLPVPVPTDERFVQIATSTLEVCAVRADGALFCWRLPYQEPTLPPLEQTPGKWLSVVVYGWWLPTRCAIRSDGVCLCWGQEINGELGNGPPLDDLLAEPTPLGPLHAYDTPPRAGFEVENDSYRAVSSSDDNGIVRFVWSFGDGATAEGDPHTHVFAENGVYWVTLTAIDRTGRRGMESRAVVVDR